MKECEDVSNVDYSGSYSGISADCGRGFTSMDIRIDGAEAAEAFKTMSKGPAIAIDVEKPSRYEESVQVLNALASKIKRECAMEWCSDDTHSLAQLIQAYTGLLH